MTADDFDEDDDCCPECHGKGTVERPIDDLTWYEVICGLCLGSGIWAGRAEGGEAHG